MSVCIYSKTAWKTWIVKVRCKVDIIHHYWACNYSLSSTFMGRVILKQMPSSVLLVQLIEPFKLWCTRLYTIFIPRPLPPWPLFVVKNGSNILFRFCLDTPLPLSVYWMFTLLLLVDRLIVIKPLSTPSNPCCKELI